ncbi:MAG: ribonuclease Z [Flavobacteriaceae bacterium]|nr:ribonuclease Z [Flavobacteriaceae bacterium]
MKLTILGCYAATPRTFSNPTSQVLEMQNQLFLIDCAEGTQVELRRNKIKFSRIKHIFISHLHGDHFYGLIGLISSFRLLNRTQELHIYGPKGLEEIIKIQFKHSDSWVNFPLIFHELTSKEPELIYEDEKLTVSTIPLKHRVYTNGFFFKEKPHERKLNPVACRQHGVEICDYQNLKNGKDYKKEDGEQVANSLLTFDPAPPKSYAYCSDTVFDTSLPEKIKGATVLYHEATFLEQHAHLGQPTKHSTAAQAAQVAKSAGVGTLILGHFSTRYDSTTPFKQEAETIFPAVELADDGKVFVFD